MPYTKEEKAAIWLDSFGLDRAKKAQVAAAAGSAWELARRFPSLRAAVTAIAGEECCARMEESLASGGYLGGLLEGYARRGIRCVTYHSTLYPSSLRALPEPPLVLYCKGRAELLGERKFAVVGSRRTPAAILAVTEKFAARLARCFAVVSGIADGGDAAALQGALQGGAAIAVLPYGFDHVYPECNASLLERIVQNGLAVSEYLPQEGPRTFRFLARNRIIAGLAEGVLVVSGGLRSGTRSTAEKAYEYGKDVFAFAYPPGVAEGAGCNALIKQYAKLTDDLVDIGLVYGINLTETEDEAPAEELSAAERAVLDALAGGELHVHEIAGKCGLAPHELAPVLTLLEMKGRVAACGGNRYAPV